jgi:hypothetical protein
MLLTKTFLVAAAIAGGLLASPPAAAAPRRIPEPPPWPAPRTQLCKSALQQIVDNGSNDGRHTADRQTAIRSVESTPWLEWNPSSMGVRCPRQESNLRVRFRNVRAAPAKSLQRPTFSPATNRCAPGSAPVGEPRTESTRIARA